MTENQSAQVNPCNPPDNPRITCTTNPSGWVPGIPDMGKNHRTTFERSDTQPKGEANDTECTDCESLGE